MGDPIDSQTVLLLHCDGVDASTSFPDSSQYNNVVTAVGNAQVDTAQYKFLNSSGTSASILLDGTGDYLSVPDSSNFVFGTNSFTIDTWFRFTDVTVHSNFYSQSTNGSSYFTFYWYAAGNQWRLLANGAEVLLFADTLSNDTWYHLALVRNGNSFTVYRDGVSKGTNTNTVNIADYTSAITIGHDGQGVGSDFKGWMDEYRVSNGVARWTTNFTPPTSPYGISGADKFFLVL